MGSVLGVCSVVQLACCCGSAACGLCCTGCPSCKNSTSTRIMYAIMLLIATITCCSMLSPGLADELKSLPFCGGFECKHVVGYLAVYRVCFSVTIFFLVLAAFMIGVKSSQDPRAPIQNGFWAVKYLVLIAITIGAFYIPEGTFGSTWMYFGMIGGFLFILIQLILIVDFVHNWAETWVERYEETQLNGWYCLLATFTVFHYALITAASVLFWIFYSSADGCGINQFFIIFNLLLCVLMSVLSILPAIQDHQPSSGLLQASAVSLYCTFLVWSAMRNNPNTDCKPKFLKSSGSSFDIQSIVGIILWISCVLYSSIRNSSKVDRFSLGTNQYKNNDNVIAATPDVEIGHETETGKPGPKDGQQVWDNEGSKVAYSWSFFHLMFAMATLYIMMTLTSWFTPSQNLTEWTANQSTVWIKIVSSWICSLLYIWTLLAPWFYPDREF